MGRGGALDSSKPGDGYGRRPAWPAAMALVLAMVAVVAPWTGPRQWVLHESESWYHRAVGVGGLASAGAFLIGAALVGYLPKGRRSAAGGMAISAATQSAMAIVEYMRTAPEPVNPMPSGFSVSFVYQYPATTTIALAAVTFYVCRRPVVGANVRRLFDMNSGYYRTAVGLALSGVILPIIHGPSATSVVEYVVAGVLASAGVFVAVSAFCSVPRITVGRAAPILLAFSAIALTTSTVGMARSRGPTLIGPVSHDGILFFIATFFTGAMTLFCVFMTYGAQQSTLESRRFSGRDGTGE